MDLAQRKKFLDIITKETERLTRLINKILDLSKLESGDRVARVAYRHEGSDRKHDMTAASQLFKEKDVRLKQDY